MVRIKIDEVNTECGSKVDTKKDVDGQITVPYTKDLLAYRIDSRHYVPSCIITKDGDKHMVYTAQPNIWLWSTIGLTGLLLLIFLITILKGGGGYSSGPMMWR
jgi:hypothetical protein